MNLALILRAAQLAWLADVMWLVAWIGPTESSTSETGVMMKLANHCAFPDLSTKTMSNASSNMVADDLDPGPPRLKMLHRDGAATSEAPAVDAPHLSGVTAGLPSHGASSAERHPNQVKQARCPMK